MISRIIANFIHNNHISNIIIINKIKDIKNNIIVQANIRIIIITEVDISKDQISKCEEEAITEEIKDKDQAGIIIGITTTIKTKTHMVVMATIINQLMHNTTVIMVARWNKDIIRLITISNNIRIIMSSSNIHNINMNHITIMMIKCRSEISLINQVFIHSHTTILLNKSQRLMISLLIHHC